MIGLPGRYLATNSPISRDDRSVPPPGAEPIYMSIFLPAKETPCACAGETQARAARPARTTALPPGFDLRISPTLPFSFGTGPSRPLAGHFPTYCGGSEIPLGSRRVRRDLLKPLQLHTHSSCRFESEVSHVVAPRPRANFAVRTLAAVAIQQ